MSHVVGTITAKDGLVKGRGYALYILVETQGITRTVAASHSFLYPELLSDLRKRIR
jgi:hypothetical protein